METIKENYPKELKAILESAYEICMEGRVKRWRTCIVTNEVYFEGDNSIMFYLKFPCTLTVNKSIGGKLAVNPKQLF